MAQHVDERVEPGATSTAVAQEATFAPQVVAPRPRIRLGFVVAFALAVAAGVVTLLVQRQAPREAEERRPVVAHELAGCTALTVAQTIRDPNLSEPDRVACLAVAGDLEGARRRLRGMPSADQAIAISRVFAIAHPIADSGDDRSAGPIMALVVEFAPDNYMAVFHAGMAAFALGDDVTAARQLQRFLEMYSPHDISE